VEELFGPVLNLNPLGSEEVVQVRSALVVDAIADAIDEWPEWLVNALWRTVRVAHLRRSDIIQSQTAV